MDCARYIERNPLRAQLVEHPEDYKWSSFLCYAVGRKNVIIKELNPLYLQLAQSDAERCSIYRDYMLEERPYELLVDKGVGIE